MPDAWDTSVVSRIGIGERHAQLLDAHRRAGLPVPIPTPVVQEIVRGLARPAAHNPRASARLRWFGLLFRDPLADLVSFDRTAAQLAGRLLACQPHPPTRDRRRRGTRPQQRAAWALDVQIAACAFAGGYGVLTENVDDFGVLRDTIAALLPDISPLTVKNARV